MQRLLNSKKRDINRKGVIPEGDVGLGKADTDGMLLSDDEDDIVEEDEDEDDEGEEQMDGSEGLSNKDAGLGVPPKSADKAYDRQRVVPKGDADMRLDRWLKLQLPHLPNSIFQKLLRKRKIRVVAREAAAAKQGPSSAAQGKEGEEKASPRVKLDGKRHLQVGDVVIYPAYLETLKQVDSRPRVRREMKPLSEEDTKLAQSWVIYKDERVIALNKPPGLPVQGGSDVGDNHLGRFLSALKFDKEEVPRLVHRLDKECSGVLIMGRTRADAAYFTSLFKQKQVTKQYWAVLAGVPNPRGGRIAAPLKELGQGMGVAKDMNEEDAKMAITRYETRGDAANEISFVELWPWTGRKHQLRVHCAQVLNAPILGDDKYGSQEVYEKFELMLSTIDNLHLHCRSLEIPHPIKEKQRLKIMAAPPPYFKRTMDTFEFSEQGDQRPSAPAAPNPKKKVERKTTKLHVK